jgi:pimeloyl-ACP methyl ester carboxylesterase
MIILIGEMGINFTRKWAQPSFFLSMRASLKYPLPEFAKKAHAQAKGQHDAWERLPEITAPTLILHSSDNQVNPAENAGLLAQRNSDADLYLVRRGHPMFFIEFHKEFDRIIIAFL